MQGLASPSIIPAPATTASIVGPVIFNVMRLVTKPTQCVMHKKRPQVSLRVLLSSLTFIALALGFSALHDFDVRDAVLSFSFAFFAIGTALAACLWIVDKISDLRFR